MLAAAGGGGAAAGAAAAAAGGVAMAAGGCWHEGRPGSADGRVGAAAAMEVTIAAGSSTSTKLTPAAAAAAAAECDEDSSASPGAKGNHHHHQQQQQQHQQQQPPAGIAQAQAEAKCSSQQQQQQEDPGSSSSSSACRQLGRSTSWDGTRKHGQPGGLPGSDGALYRQEGCQWQWAPTAMTPGAAAVDLLTVANASSNASHRQFAVPHGPCRVCPAASCPGAPRGVLLHRWKGLWTRHK